MPPTTLLRLARRVARATAAAALLAPAGASAEPFVFAGPVKAGAYELQLVGFGDTLAVSLNRTAGPSRQTHGYSFTRNARVTPRSIKADLGRYGAISLTLTGAKRAAGTVPPGCTGDPGASRKGTFKGSLRFAADPALGTVRAKRLPGEVSTTGSLDCDAADDPAAAGRRLMLTQLDGARTTLFEATATRQSVMVTEDAAATAPATVIRSIEATGTGFEAAPDLSTATVPAIGPFLTGTGSYEGMGLDIGSFGTLGGSLVARFDVIGDVALQGDASIQ